MMESFKEFCEGLIGMKGNIFQRNQLFNKKQLESQYSQLTKAVKCNRKRGAVKNEE